ncbi:MAG TPA: hypothetical protein VGA21_15560 [Cyclobacteriaceae bacterium]|jgi:uncharacterized membrane protein YidH (DUF202 family)
MRTRNSAFILIVLGILMLIYTGFNFVTTERVVDLGPLKIDKQKNHSVAWPPIVGIVLVVGGVFLLGKTKKGRAI